MLKILLKMGLLESNAFYTTIDRIYSQACIIFNTPDESFYFATPRIIPENFDMTNGFILLRDSEARKLSFVRVKVERC